MSRTYCRSTVRFVTGRESRGEVSRDGGDARLPRSIPAGRGACGDMAARGRARTGEERERVVERASLNKLDNQTGVHASQPYRLYNERETSP
jgi:hypothetical protein